MPVVCVGAVFDCCAVNDGVVGVVDCVGAGDGVVVGALAVNTGVMVHGPKSAFIVTSELK